MTVISNPLLLKKKAAAGGGGSAYNIEKSLRFADPAEPSLKRHFTTGNRYTWTWAAWVKRSLTGVQHNLFSAYADGNNQGYLVLESDDAIAFDQRIGGTWSNATKTTRLFRDLGAWFHITFVFDSNNVIESERIRLYINGERETSFSDAPNCTQYLTGKYNSNIEHQIGKGQANSNHMDGYLADVHFIDGLALSPGAFGSFDTLGSWNPKAFELPTPNANTTWSSGLSHTIAGSAGTWSSAAANAFKGIASSNDAYQAVSQLSSGSQDIIITWVPPSDLKNVQTFRVNQYSGTTSANYIIETRVNEESWTRLSDLPGFNSGNDGIWHDFSELIPSSRKITKVEWRRIGTPNTHGLNVGSIEVNGVILKDGKTDQTYAQWESDQAINVGRDWGTGAFQKATNGGSLSAWDGPDDLGFSGRITADEPDNQTSKCVVAGSGVNNATVKWTVPGAPIQGTNFKLYCYQPQGTAGITNTLSINGATAIPDTDYDGVSANDVGWTANIAIPAGGLTSLEMYFAYSGGHTWFGWYAIQVDGVVLTNGASNSYHLKFGDATRHSALGKDSLNGKIANATGGKPFYVTSDTFGETKGDGYNSEASTAIRDALVLALPGDVLTDEHDHVNTGSSAHTVTNNGSNVVVTTEESRLYGSSLDFGDGHADNYLSLPDHADFEFGTGDFCIEAWVRCTSASQTNNIWSQRNGSHEGISFRIDSNKRVDYFNDNSATVSINSGSNTVTLSTWNHVAVTRASSTTKLWLNGKEVASVSDSTNYDSNTVAPRIGGSPTNTYEFFSGQIQDLRVYKGNAKYTANFVAPNRNDFNALNLNAKTGGIDYQGNTTAAASGETTSMDSTHNLAKLYSGGGDGDYIATASANIMNNNGATLTLTFSPGISISNTAVMRAYNHGNCSWSYNGGAFSSLNSTGDWLDITLHSGSSSTMTSCAFRRIKTTGNNTGSAEISRLVIDGVQLSQSQYIATYDVDSMTDSPTNYEPDGGDTGLGGEIRGNFCTLNPNDTTNGNAVTSYGNLKVGGASAWSSIRGTLGVKASWGGKWYWEHTLVDNPVSVMTGMIGHKADLVANLQDSATECGKGIVCYMGDDGKYQLDSNSRTTYGSVFSSGDTLGILLNLTSGSETVNFYKNNTDLGTIDISSSKLVTEDQFIMPLYIPYNSGANHRANFGQIPFKYNRGNSAGAKCICTANFPDTFTGGEVNNPSKYFDVKTWTGNGATGTNKVPLNFQPDFVWIKGRDTTWYHQNIDAVRGKDSAIYSNGNDVANNSADDRIDSWSSTGITLGNSVGVNQDTKDYVGWFWDAGTAGAANDDGSTDIASPNQWKNATAGFSITKYTGNGASRTIGHGLGAKPDFWITKDLDEARTHAWRVWHTGLSGMNYRLELNKTDAEATSSTSWDNTAPTASVLSLGADDNTNKDGNDYILYCWTAINGYSAFGTYAGLGENKFIYTGFQPRWIMIKVKSESNTQFGWRIIDTARDPENTSGIEQKLTAENTCSENASPISTSEGKIDILSNGFNIQDNHSVFNTTSRTYIYAAFAEHPLKTARAR